MRSSRSTQREDEPQFYYITHQWRFEGQGARVAGKSSLMDSTALKSLHKATNFCFRSRAPLFRPFNLVQLKHTLHLYLSSLHRISSLCSLNGEAEISQESTLPHGTGEAADEASRPKILQVVLVSPQIPGNTGAIARTCAASAVGLHLVGPMAFKVDSNKLKRAGLDYWPYVVVKIHDSWANFRDYFRQQCRMVKSGC